MNRGNLFLVAFCFALAPFAARANAVWGGNEVRQAAGAALDHFREQKGSALYDAVAGVSVDVTSQGNAARAKVTYTEAGAKQTASYFCHTHDSAIDCH